LWQRSHDTIVILFYEFWNLKYLILTFEPKNQRICVFLTGLKINGGILIVELVGLNCIKNSQKKCTNALYFMQFWNHNKNPC
jgi:hypothetical protein